MSVPSYREELISQIPAAQQQQKKGLLQSLLTGEMRVRVN
jgi:hypothetical protein